jgi:hypothetical protein
MICQNRYVAQHFPLEHTAYPSPALLLAWFALQHKFAVSQNGDIYYVPRHCVRTASVRQVIRDIFGDCHRRGEVTDERWKNHGLCRLGLRSKTKDNGKLIAKGEKRGYGRLKRGEAEELRLVTETWSNKPSQNMQTQQDNTAP